MGRNVIEVDNQIYEEGEQVWDLGSWEHVGDPEATRRDYQGLEADIPKLPHYVDAGSTATCLDTGKYLVFHKKLDEWIVQE